MMALSARSTTNTKRQRAPYLLPKLLVAGSNPVARSNPSEARRRENGNVDRFRGGFQILEEYGEEAVAVHKVFDEVHA